MKQEEMNPIVAEFDQKANEVLSQLDLSRPLTAKEKTKIPVQLMPEQSAEERRHNIQEVTYGYSAAQARVEALRCLNCANAPCIKDCPVHLDIPGFIKEIANGSFEQAIHIIKKDSLLPAVCGRVCPQESQCQSHCTLGKVLKDPEQAVSIGRLERFVADFERENGNCTIPQVLESKKYKVGVVGSGPASLVVAADVRRLGYEVTLFEAFHKPGGVMMYGIPEFRLPKAIVQNEIETLKKMGVQICSNYVVGRTRKLLDIMEKDGYHALFIGTGAGLPKFLNIPGENLPGVFAANEYLTRANLMRAYDREKADTPIPYSKNVAVIGGGNVAMDAARMALRLGAEKVFLLYRRTEAEMPARIEEIHHAKAEGVQFMTLVNPVRFIADEQGFVSSVECLRYELGELDRSGRPRPVAIPGSEFILPIDTAIVSVGNGSNPLISKTTPGLKVDEHGRILVNEGGETSIPGIFAGGDIVLGAATVILAMGEGRKAARSIDQYLKNLGSKKSEGE